MKLLNNFKRSTLFIISVLTNVSLMLQFKLPPNIELIKTDSKAIPVHNLKVGFIDKDNILLETQFEARREFCFNSDNKMYTVSLDFVMTHKILSFCNSNENKKYDVLEFIYDNKFVRFDSKVSESNKLDYADKFFIVLDSFIGDELKFKTNFDDSRIQNAKYILSKFENRFYEKICNNKIIFDHLFFERHAKFNTQHFFNHTLCFEELKKFLSSLQSLKIANENNQELVYMTDSYLNTFFLEKYCEEFKELSEENIETRKVLETFCIDQGAKLIKDVFLLPFLRNQENGHHLRNTYKMLITLVESIQKITPRFDNNLKTYFDQEEAKGSLKMYFANEWLKYILCNTNKPLNFHEYQSNRYGMNKKRIYNSEELEKIVCDYYNTLIFISNYLDKGNMNNHSDLKYVEPLKTYKLECSIFKAIQFNIENKVHKIRTYNHLSNEIILKENLDYFKFNYTSFQSFVFPFKIMRKHKIVEIELIFLDEKNKKIKTSDYLSLQEEDLVIKELGKETSKLSCHL